MILIILIIFYLLPFPTRYHRGACPTYVLLKLFFVMQEIVALALQHPSSIQHPKWETAYPSVFIGNSAVLCTLCVILSSENEKRDSFGGCQGFECFP